MTEKWIKGLDLDVFNCVKKMIIHGKQFHTNPSEEYENSNLRTPYRLLALMLDRIFDRANGKFYKISWVPLIYFVATRGTIFNWDDIVENNLSS